MADQNIEFGEAPVEISVNTQQATPAAIGAIAKEIWQRITKSKVAIEDNPGNDRLLEALQAEFADFNKSFPLVLRWMVQMRKFRPKAFKKYLLKHASAKLDSRQAFLELQAEYLVLLYREEHSHPDERHVQQYRTSVVETLLEEDKVFLEVQREVEADLARQASEVAQDRRLRLYEYLLAQKDATASRQPPGGVPAATHT